MSNNNINETTVSGKTRYFTNSELFQDMIINLRILKLDMYV